MRRLAITMTELNQAQVLYKGIGQFKEQYHKQVVH